MMKTRLAIAALVTVGLAGAPFAAEAKKYKHIGHHISTMQSGTYGTSGMSTTHSGAYGHPELLLELSPLRQWGRTIGRR